MRRLSLLATLPLFASVPAFAQAPGETPVDAAPVAPAAPPAYRFAVGLGIGGMGIAPTEDPEAKTDFSIGELALRYRATRHLELEVAIAGGRQTVDGEEGELAVGTFSAGARWRFAPERRWNWFVAAGLGAATIARHDATAEQRDATARPIGHVGVGVERRFRRLALQAELRLVGLGPVVVEDRADTAMSRAPVPAPASPGELAGGRFTLGGSYYF
ncbi:MAG: hypothetical protein KF773_11970 [Deltaproteobacteria bacterium]|nr:hypothetical protein [Deltaproteobacteria bacterium]